MAPAADSVENEAIAATLSDLVLHSNGKGSLDTKLKAGSETGSNGSTVHVNSSISSNGAARPAYVPYGVTMVERRPPGILGMGTANPPNIYRMEDFAEILRMPNFICPPEAAGFIERICKHDDRNLPPSPHLSLSLTHPHSSAV